MQKAGAVNLNPVVLGVGFLRGHARKKNEERLSRFWASSRVTTVAVDEETDERYPAILDGLWTAGTPIPTNGMGIAASARQYSFTVVTTDAHYLKIPQVLVFHAPSAK